MWLETTEPKIFLKRSPQEEEEEYRYEISSRCKNLVIRVFTTPENPGNLVEFKNPPGNPGNLLEFNWSSWKFLCKMSKISRIGFQS